MSRANHALCIVALVFATTGVATVRVAGADPAWKVEAAGKYLDGRQKAWFEYATADRGEETTKTSCVCCHTLVTYGLARPVLRKLTGDQGATAYEKQLLEQTKLRVEKWADLDSAKYQLLYDFSDQKKKESWGTEAILNSLILAFNDLYTNVAAPSTATTKAFENLWSRQVTEGAQKGSWDWLDFNNDSPKRRYEPWESTNARYYGACLAAVAVGTAPGYYTPGAVSTLDEKVKLLRSYLKDNYQSQSLYNQVWALYATITLDGVLDGEQRKDLIARLLTKQRDDGGWSLSSLGTFARSDGTPQETVSDGYATGLVLHILQSAGVKKDDQRVAKGLSWLVSNQEATGEWKAYSLNKKRDLTSHVGRFMADAATAYAVLALNH
jgi:squalene-hopene/tetraprenyl-beta-curcumene cyclase